MVFESIWLAGVAIAYWLALALMLVGLYTVLGWITPWLRARRITRKAGHLIDSPEKLEPAEPALEIDQLVAEFDHDWQTHQIRKRG